MNIRYPIYEGVYRILTLVKGFKNREGNSFDAALVLHPDFTVGYSFPERKPQEKKGGRKK